jgi:hypothetical protein
MVIFQVLVPGCLSRQTADNNPPSLPAMTNTSSDISNTGTVGPGLNNTSNGPVNQHHKSPPKKLGLIVHSADLYRTLPGWNLMNAGSGIAIINVSITNNLATDYRLERENFCIKTARDKCANEHGGDRAPEGDGGKYMRFPLKFSPGETKTGSVIYLLETGTEVNDLILTDGTGKLITKVDLHKIYNYH